MTLIINGSQEVSVLAPPKPKPIPKPSRYLKEWSRQRDGVSW
jgi:hypothetical protein